MAELLISQEEGDALLAMRKVPLNDNFVDLPDAGGSADIVFTSENALRNLF